MRCPLIAGFGCPPRGTAKKSTATVEPRWFVRACASSERVASAAAASAEKPSARRRRTPPSTIPHGCEARPRVGSRRPSPGPGVGRRRRSAAGLRGDAIGVSNTTEDAAMPGDDSGGSDDHQGPFPVRPCPSQSDPEQPIGPDEWRASVGCDGRQPTAAAARGSPEPECRRRLARTITSRTTWMNLATIRSA